MFGILDFSFSIKGYTTNFVGFGDLSSLACCKQMALTFSLLPLLLSCSCSVVCFLVHFETKSLMLISFCRLFNARAVAAAVAGHG